MRPSQGKQIEDGGHLSDGGHLTDVGQDGGR